MIYINNNIIYYENIKNEEYNIIGFNNNNKLEYLLVHNFDNNLENNYLIIGKFTNNVENIIKEGTICKNTIKKIIEKYKNNCEELIKNNSYKYYEASFIKNFLFTKEGYDLITHKFLFTNNKIIKTIEIEQQTIENIKYYTNTYYALDNEITECFKDFEYYEKFYTLRTEEFQNLDINNIYKYVKANFYKIKNIIKSNEESNFEIEISTLKTILETIEKNNKSNNKVKSLKK